MVTRHNTASSAWAPPIRRWRLAAVMVVPAAVLAMPSAASAASQGLPAGCVASATNVSCTYAPVGHEQQFVVPPRVASVQVTAAGAAGAQSAFTPTGAAGRGALVTGTLAVLAGSTLYVEVGGNPAPTGLESCSTFSSHTDPCNGGWNGGANGGNGGGGASAGGGGGASDVQTVSIPGSGIQDAPSLNSRVLVAGGGGGSGASGGSADCATTLSPPVAGGAGGNAGTAGAPAGECTTTGVSTSGGGAGTGSTFGAFGENSVTGGTDRQGNNGSLGFGGTDPSLGGNGGGGGGGLYGGGSGAAIALNGQNQIETGGSGGGGGSSLTTAHGTVTISPGTAGSVTISYDVGPNAADLGIKIRGPRSAAAGSRFSEALVVTNYGPAVALDVTTIASLPRHLSVITASRLMQRVNDGLRWTDPALRPGESVTYRITFGVAPAVNARVSLRGTTAATGSPDPNVNNNTAVAAIRLHTSRSHH